MDFGDVEPEIYNTYASCMEIIRFKKINSSYLVPREGQDKLRLADLSPVLFVWLGEVVW